METNFECWGARVQELHALLSQMPILLHLVPGTIGTSWYGGGAIIDDRPRPRHVSVTHVAVISVTSSWSASVSDTTVPGTRVPYQYGWAPGWGGLER